MQDQGGTLHTKAVAAMDTKMYMEQEVFAGPTDRREVTNRLWQTCSWTYKEQQWGNDWPADGAVDRSVEDKAGTTGMGECNLGSNPQERQKIMTIIEECHCLACQGKNWRDLIQLERLQATIEPQLMEAQCGFRERFGIRYG